VLTVQKGESGGVVDVELVGRVMARRSSEERRRACRPRLGDLGRQVQVLQHAANDGGVVDERDEPESPPAAGTGQHIQAQAPAHQLRPGVIVAVTTVHPVWMFLSALVGITGGRVGRFPVLDDARPPRRAGREDAVVQQQVNAGPRRQRRESLQQFHWIEHQMRGPVRPRPLKPCEAG